MASQMTPCKGWKDWMRLDRGCNDREELFHCDYHISEALGCSIPVMIAAGIQCLCLFIHNPISYKL